MELRKNYFCLSAVFLLLKKHLQQRVEAALMTACFTRYLCLFTAKSIWKGEEASVTYNKSRVLWKQGLRSAFKWNSFTKLKHIFSASWRVTKLGLWRIRYRAYCGTSGLAVKSDVVFPFLSFTWNSFLSSTWKVWKMVRKCFQVLIDVWEMQSRCESGDPGDGEFPSGVAVLELVALETHCHMSCDR